MKDDEASKKYKARIRAAVERFERRRENSPAPPPWDDWKSRKTYIIRMSSLTWGAWERILNDPNSRLWQLVSAGDHSLPTAIARARSQKSKRRNK